MHLQVITNAFSSNLNTINFKIYGNMMTKAGLTKIQQIF